MGGPGDPLDCPREQRRLSKQSRSLEPRPGAQQPGQGRGQHPRLPTQSSWMKGKLFMGALVCLGARGTDGQVVDRELK